jgi:hypothetical protein
MAEYIDRDKLVKELECGIRAGNYEKGYDGYTHINSIDDCVDTVKYFDKADVVEREKIDKAIEEITGYSRFHRDKTHNDTERGKYLAYEKCIEILKRNIGEE